MRIAILLLFIFCAAPIFGQETTKSASLKITHLTGDFYVYTTYKDLNGYLFPSNSMYVVTKAGVVLFDTPWDTTQFQPLLDSISVRHKQKVVLAIATHYHDDRTAGIEFLKLQGIKTYSSKLTYDLCKEHHEKQTAYYFTRDTAFTVGQYKFDTHYPGEGHTKDNIVIWNAKEKILYGGCLVKSTENNGLGNIADANLTQWEVTIKNVMKKYPNPSYIIPGHFGWTSNNGLSHTLKLLDQNKSK